MTFQVLEVWTLFKGLSGICEIEFLTAVHFSKY